MKKIIFLSIFVSNFLILNAGVAYPTTCLQISHREEFRRTDVIFAGQVIDILEDKSFIPPKLNDPNLPRESLIRLQKIVDLQKRYLVRFKVEQKWKGANVKEITLFMIQSDSPASGIGFTKDEKYLIYASYSKNGLSDNGVCSRTRPLDKANKEYKELNSFWFRFMARLPFPI